MSELGEPLLEVLREDDPAADESRFGRGWRPRPWWGWTIALLTIGACALLGAGALLANADFGTSLRPRGCDGSSLPGLGLLALGGLSFALGLQVASLRWEEAFIVWDAGSLLVSLPLPIALLAGTLPGVFGCALGRDIAQLGLIGDSLVGTPGIALAAAASVLLGGAIASCAHVAWLVLDTGAAPAPGIVELAMQEAEALKADEAAARFHGVESGE